jgi:hypothetical protein
MSHNAMCAAQWRSMKENESQTQDAEAGNMGELTLEERGSLIVRACLEQTSTSPYQVFRDVARQDFVRMHGPEHHVLDGAALLTAYRNAGGSVDLPSQRWPSSCRAACRCLAPCAGAGACAEPWRPWARR